MAYQFEKSGQLKPPSAEEFAEADRTSAVIVLDQGELDDGSPYWAYIAVKPSKYQEFMQATTQRKPIRLTEYGAILKFGFDKDVPTAAKEEMKQEHRCDDNYLACLTERVMKAQKEFLSQRETHRISDIVAMMKKKQCG